MSSLTCNAVLGCISQSARSCHRSGLGQQLTTAKESSRSEMVRTRQLLCERESERGGGIRRVQRCPCAPGLSLGAQPAPELLHPSLCASLHLLLFSFSFLSNLSGFNQLSLLTSTLLSTLLLWYPDPPLFPRRMD